MFDIKPCRYQQLVQLYLTAHCLDEKLQIPSAELLRNVRPPKRHAVQPQNPTLLGYEYEYRFFP